MGEEPQGLQQKPDTTMEEAEFLWKQTGPVDGMHFPPLRPGMTSWEDKIKELRQMKLRDDDVLLLTFPKAGTHWLWEVLSMLRKGRAEHDKDKKIQLMMDFVAVEKLDNLPSPRTLNTHLPLSMLPLPEIKARRVKMVHVYRNPKDSCVSSFFMLKSIQGRGYLPANAFEEYFEFYFFGTRQPYGSYFNYMKQIMEFQQQNPEVPFISLSYEDVKKDPVRNVKKLAHVMCLDVTDELCSRIAEACRFENMKKQEAEKVEPEFTIREPSPELESDLKASRQFQVYRKGQVGDWKNYFTVAMSERVDELIKREMKDLPFTLTFD